LGISAEDKEGTGIWIGQHDEELHNFHFSREIIRVAKTKRRDGQHMKHAWAK
jgi:hypothetical protein